MKGSSVHADSTNGSNKNRSDLVTIRGIGSIRKRWLNTLGIYTIADLAQASADEIELRAKSEGRSIARSELEEWITQAQIQQADLSGCKDEVLEAADLPEQALEIHDAPCLNGSSDDSSLWSDVASFQVEYQTRQVAGKSEQRMIVRHLETDVIATWPNFEAQLAQQWMLDRVEAAPQPEPPVVPEIIQLRVIQSNQAEQSVVLDKIHPLLPSVLQAGESFGLEVSMQFAELTEPTQQQENAILRSQIAYKVQCIARELSTGSTLTLGEMTTTLPLEANSIHNVLLPPLMLPHSGIYRLKVWVTLLNASTTASTTSASFKVPMLQVV